MLSWLYAVSRQSDLELLLFNLTPVRRVDMAFHNADRPVGVAIFDRFVKLAVVIVDVFHAEAGMRQIPESEGSAVQSIDSFTEKSVVRGACHR